MRTAIILGALALAGCAAQADPAQSRKQERAERELAKALEGRVAGEPTDCISSMGSNGPQIIDANTLLYRQGSRVWRNDLDGGCPGLDPGDTLIIEVHGSQLCRRDMIRVREPGSSILGPSCSLGKFTPYTKAK
ncbi:DUF6491 family protein [Sphingomonas soli]|uniref:DUF6491 family protein n=1 Tax=Sphingomonas soli TaxID=266127 RepID=UPI000830A62D|nr:DUF6491 family protein [Sphingomonas soli]